MPKWMPLPIMQLAFKNCVICKMVGIVMLRPVPEALLPGTEQSRRLGAEAGKVPLKSDLDIVAEITSKLNPTHVFDITPHPVGDIYLEIMRLSGKYEGIVGVISKGTIEVTGYPVNFLPMDEAQMNEQVTYKTFTSDQIPECATFINQLLQ